MVRSHSGPDPCYYRAADLGTKWSHCVRCCRGWCRSNEDKAMCHTPTYNYKLHACVQLHTQTEARSHQRSHTAFADSQTDTSWHRSSTRTFIFMLHCIEFNTQNLVLGLGNRDRKVIQKRGLCVISLCHSSRARTHAHTHAATSVLFEKGPVGLSGHVDSSFCETETKHLLCVASAPLHTCFPGSRDNWQNLLDFCSSHAASGLYGRGKNKKKHLS